LILTLFAWFISIANANANANAGCDDHEPGERRIAADAAQRRD
jgi:hypothetical protein